MYLDGIWLKHFSWGGEVETIAPLVAIGVDQHGNCLILGVAEGMKEDPESWQSFLRWLKQQGLKGVKLVTSDKCLGLLEALGEFYPEASWQRCMVHWQAQCVAGGTAREVQTGGRHVRGRSTPRRIVRRLRKRPSRWPRSSKG